MLLLNTNRKPYTMSPTVHSYLTLNDLDILKSRSLILISYISYSVGLGGMAGVLAVCLVLYFL